MAWSLLAAITFAWLASAMQRRRMARGPRTPLFSWCISVSMLCPVSGVRIGDLTDQPYSHRIHGEVALSQLVLTLIARVFLLLGVRRKLGPAAGLNGPLDLTADLLRASSGSPTFVDGLSAPGGSGDGA